MTPTPTSMMERERGTAFDIHFRVIENATAHVALATGCHRFVIRD